MFGNNLFSGVKGLVFSVIAGLILSPGIWKAENRIILFLEKVSGAHTVKTAKNSVVTCGRRNVQSV